MSNKKNIAFFTEIKNGKVSGPTNSVTMLAKNLIDLGYKVNVFTVCLDNTVELVNDVEIHPLIHFYGTYEQYSLCIFEGIYKFKMWELGRFCNTKDIKYIISPRSNLMKNSFKKSLFKKILSFPFFYSYLIKSAGLHFLSNEERINSFRFFHNSFVARNGVNLQAVTIRKTPGNKVMFLGRFDLYHKGLDDLLYLINNGKKQLRDLGVIFDLFGPDYRGGKKKIKRLIIQYGLEDLINIHSPIFGDEKILKMSEYKYFIHMSRFEGQPQAVLESIAAGCTPLVTKYCNLNDLISSLYTGYQIDKYTDIAKLLNSNKEDCIENDLELFSESFSWKNSAKEFQLIINKVLLNE
jgi:glycosyltransferase involved in cell wall biosynthesis